MNARRRLSSVAPDEPPRVSFAAHWLNPNWRYIPTRLDSPEQFRQRMKERAERAKEKTK